MRTHTNILLDLGSVMARNVVVQFKLGENEIEDLFSFEESLAQGIEQSRSGMVDGNDIGKHTYNIYVIPRSSHAPCVNSIKMWLKAKKLLSKAVIAHTTAKGNVIVDHPEQYPGEFDYGI